MDEFWKDIAPLITQYGVKIIGVLVLLFVAWILAGWGGRAATRGMLNAHVDATLSKFLGRMVKWAVLVFALLGCLGVFGVEVTSFAAVLAAAGFAIGLSLQGSLSNFAAGVMLLMFRPFKVGDVVNVAGQSGVVDEIGIFNTTIDSFDNRRLIVPNGAVFGSTIENITFHEVRRVDVNVGTDYDADLDQTRGVLEQAIGALPDQAADRDPQVVLLDLGDSSINWQVRVWTATSNFAGMKQEVTRAVKIALDEAGIGIPFPQRDLHIDGVVATTGA
ncbi:MAG: mechanosensitive ion channel family protein [Planctomycetota bacterium]|jgi:small conductance mechanosensitive channel